MSIETKAEAAWKIAFEYFLKKELDKQYQTEDHEPARRWRDCGGTLGTTKPNTNHQTLT